VKYGESNYVNSRITCSNAIQKLFILLAISLTSCQLLAQDQEPIGRHYDIPIVLEPNQVVISQPEVLDLNGDGKQDVVFSSMDFSDVDAEAPLEIWTGNESGGMELSTDLLIEGGIPTSLRGFRQIIPADLNGDGRLDLFLESHGPEWDCGNGTVECWPGGQNSLLLSDEDGKLNNVTTTNLPAFSDFSHGSTVIDFDYDGDMDIFVNNSGGSPLYNPDFSYLLENDGFGHFTVAADGHTPLSIKSPLKGRNGILPEGEWPPGQSSWAVAIDANGDGHTDLDFGRTGRWADGGVQFWRTLLALNNGSGTFEYVPGDAWPPPSWSNTGAVQHALVYDLNNDGFDDQLLHSSASDWSKPWMQVLISNGDGTFRDETGSRYPFQEVEAFEEFQLHDLDGDGQPDLFNTINWTQVEVRVNDGEGNFRLLSEDWVELNGKWVVLDVDDDGGTDFFEANPNGVRLHKMNLPYGAEMDGTADDDRLIGGAHDNIYRGLEGNDVLDGGLGDDKLYGGPGDDRIDSGRGNDLLDGGPGNDELNDWSGDDKYIVNAADLTGNDLVWDYGGLDTLVFADFGLERVSSVAQVNAGHLQINFTDGGSLTIIAHFANIGQAVEWLKVGECSYRISQDAEFTSGSITEILSGCVLFKDGFE
jgi:Ca2+-binding RTX toxin-like protein